MKFLFLICYKCRFFFLDVIYKTALMIAVTKKRPEMVKLLVDFKSTDINAKDEIF